MIEFKLDGLKELTFALRRFPRQMRDAAAVGQYNAMVDVVKEAAARAPYEHGDLEAGAYVSDPDFSGRSVAVEGGFAGKAAEYAIIQHENLEYHHPGTYTKTKNPGRAAAGEAKFFEKAYNNQLQRIQDTVRKAVEYFMRTGNLPAMKRFRKGP